jgi:alkylmercury lyase
MSQIPKGTPMHTTPDQLASRLITTLDASSAGTAGGELWGLLLRLLAAGRPVSVEQLAQGAGRTVDQVRAGLAALTDTEYDDAGRIIGNGLTLRPTPHRFEVDGVQLYTWCALDTLVFPAILDRSAHVVSPCHRTGEPVRVTVAPDRIDDVDPAAAVVSIVTPDAAASIRAAFCDHVHFFATTGDAAAWLDAHPGATVLPVADAFRLGRPLVHELISGDTGAGCCSGS